MSLLSLQNVTRRFGSLTALSNISIEVPQGELRAVIGPNGAGKTTLFNLISGFFPPSEGEVVFDGQSVKGVSPEKLVHRGMTRTFQITEIFLDLSVYENLEIAVETAHGLNLRPWLSPARRRQVRAHIDELMQTLHLEDLAYRMAGELAHGDQRVVEIAIALAREPRLLLLDEPTAGMGDEETDRMTDLIRHLHRERGITMLFIEHDMSIIFNVADRITVLDNGHLLAEGTPAEISANADVQAAYLGAAQ
ncbi:ABC transporter ATP-binding protein [Salinisphaera sp. LB1]|uniref:ABC transporter ATP-binding protein n=1 Tax=Salinisphaera sp. LB1 TaxID=2183911 RepID=UPI000D706CCF|nr:ABC transporter ATP-binding protein [Salinisphaera sp. LB1]AWN14544.1 Branched-chain amino acid transport ATP-binding protein LivG [Salinisphaera sp. LB1]